MAEAGSFSKLSLSYFFWAVFGKFGVHQIFIGHYTHALIYLLLLHLNSDLWWCLWIRDLFYLHRYAQTTIEETFWSRYLHSCWQANLGAWILRLACLPIMVFAILVVLAVYAVTLWEDVPLLSLNLVIMAAILLLVLIISQWRSYYFVSLEKLIVCLWIIELTSLRMHQVIGDSHFAAPFAFVGTYILIQEEYAIAQLSPTVLGILLLLVFLSKSEFITVIAVCFSARRRLPADAGNQWVNRLIRGTLLLLLIENITRIGMNFNDPQGQLETPTCSYNMARVIYSPKETVSSLIKDYKPFIMGALLDQEKQAKSCARNPMLPAFVRKNCEDQLINVNDFRSFLQKIDIDKTNRRNRKASQPLDSQHISDTAEKTPLDEMADEVLHAYDDLGLMSEQHYFNTSSTF